MASSRRRQSSTASGTRSLAIQARNQAISIKPRSPHIADPFLKDFLVPSFDAAAYLNATLPPLQIPGGQQQQQQQQKQAAAAAAVPLADLSTLAQNNLSQLNAHTTRLTNTLTQLTDEILRSGGRLAYEVELLRGETLGLAETLTESLSDDIGKFVIPGAIPAAVAETTTSVNTTGHSRRMSLIGTPQILPPPSPAAEPAAAAAAAPASTAPPDPPYITKLRTLTLVRSRLESVIKTFGEAMEFVFPPSELSLSSGFLSVSAPDIDNSLHSTEEKGQQVLKSLKEEILTLLANKEDPIKGVDDAVKRIEELKELSLVWKGTAEERGRAKFVEGLARLVEERHRELIEVAERERERDSRNGNGNGDNGGGGGGGGEGESSKGYAGLISQLQKLRSGI
ncbi:laminin subunit beta-4 [Podospora fimiseda]|uniref:Laminin subunit beta-4 n=1 Tax=Podospora fimiseda TaxID=252190 RepID=A0AAN7BF59_9PEZI|nr:laminin subunit beta-4 [Podospora fimiseda]